ncbi:protein FAM221B [Elgaria multicarinata webbii]|uniref:protein FAM221B n=1 Tax=Elgaria multicarinata webbii TaxID=159646 RepID=UPI002FCD0223
MTSGPAASRSPRAFLIGPAHEAAWPSRGSLADRAAALQLPPPEESPASRQQQQQQQLDACIAALTATTAIGPAIDTKQVDLCAGLGPPLCTVSCPIAALSVHIYGVEIWGGRAAPAPSAPFSLPSLAPEAAAVVMAVDGRHCQATNVLCPPTSSERRFPPLVDADSSREGMLGCAALPKIFCDRPRGRAPDSRDLCYAYTSQQAFSFWELASMEEELTEELPGGGSSSSLQVEEGPGTTSTALEVEEEIIVPTSTEGDDEDTVLPKSTSLEGEDDLKDSSFLPSSEWGTSESASVQGQSPSELSSPALGSSEDMSWSTPSSPSVSPSSCKRHRDRLQALEEEGDGTEEVEETHTDLSSISPQRTPGEQKKAKKKAVAKKGALSRSHYTVRAVVPAEKAELLSVAKAMHRENFGKNVKDLFHLEKEAALRSMETGLYIGWRCPEYLWDCFRVSDESKCFCGHLLKLHQVYVERRATVPCTVPDCKCQGYMFIPSRPEEVGEFWLRRRTGFDPAAWRAKCRCKHTHEEHVPTGARACGARGCSCSGFTSNFLCAACDRRWEEHETFFESEETRRKGGRPCGEAYLPFAEMPELRNAVLTGRTEDHSAYQALQQGPAYQALPAPSGSRALPLPPSGPRRLVEKDDKKA